MRFLHPTGRTFWCSGCPDAWHNAGITPGYLGIGSHDCLFISHVLDEVHYLVDTINIMTTRPWMVREAIKNPLPRPRTPVIITSEHLIRQKKRLVDSSHDETMTALHEQFQS